MNAMDERDRENLLAELLWRAEDDPERRRLLAADPTLAAELAELERIAGDWQASAESELAAVQRELRPGRGEEFEQRAVESLRRAVEGGGSARPRQARRWSLWLLATLASAAALVLLIEGPTRVGPAGNGTGDGLLLGDPEDVGRPIPSGEVERIDAFRWSIAPAPGAVQRVRLWYTPAPGGPASFESGPLTSPEWIPTAEVLEALGPEFRWAVFEQDPISGEQRRVLEARVRVAP